MPTPLNQFTNARLLWTAAGGRGGPETGFEILPGQQMIIGAFLKQVTPNKKDTFKSLMSLDISTDIMEGFITHYCPVPEGQDWMTYAYRSDPNYDTTGKRPDGFLPVKEIEVLMSGQHFRNAETIDTAGVFFDEGIGTIVREVIGDRLIIKFERWG